ncbi:MAG: pyrimidine 5'-nucleotidase [Hyphomicrobiaceae bacterium]|nr:pyrimidine 5'-nucleotidase [Hyphomicrobiaceae bacterium]
MERFVDTRAWIFDLDNTLYPAECNLFAQVDQRMGEFISDFLDLPFGEARKIQKAYYVGYGTTLAGLMAEHGLKPERFLDYVHDIDVSMVPPAPDLGAAIDRLPGEKYIFTNGSRQHAENVAGQLGILDRFNDVFDIGAAGYVPKPEAEAYDKFLKAHNVTAKVAAMFEDMPHNLQAPHDLGMVTVLVHSSFYDHPIQHQIREWNSPPDHVHHMTEDLKGFLDEVLTVLGAQGDAKNRKTG